ncbi:MAG: GtrA family protein [bacterium]|nr:GtrA family protein [bacterium]
MIHRLRNLEEKALCILDERAPWCAPHVRRYARVIRFILSGGTAAIVLLGSLYVLTDLLHIYYLVSSVLAFVASFVVSFTLQKFWTFQDHSMERVHVQASISFIIAVINLGLNTFLLYFLVEHVGMWYMAAQVLIGAVLAFESFFILKFIIFRRRETDAKQ